MKNNLLVFILTIFLVFSTNIQISTISSEVNNQNLNVQLYPKNTSTSVILGLKQINSVLNNSVIFNGDSLIGWKYRVNSSLDIANTIFEGYLLGNAGIGNFLLNAAKDNRSGVNGSILLQVVNHFQMNKKVSPAGNYYWGKKATPSEGYIGYRYGSAGILDFLSSYYKTYQNQSLIPLIEKAVKWFFEIRRADGNIPISPNSFYTSGLEYGMAAPVLSLVKLTSRLNNRTYLQLAEEIAQPLIQLGTWNNGSFSIEWTPFGSGTEFANLILTGYETGQAGLLKMFTDLYLSTKNSTYLRYVNGIANYLVTHDLGGYWANNTVGYVSHESNNNALTGLLSGSAGIALQLLNYSLTFNKPLVLSNVARVEKFLNLFYSNGTISMSPYFSGIRYNGLRLGVSGYLHFLMKLYESFGTESYLTKIDEIIMDQIRQINTYKDYPIRTNSPANGFAYNLADGITGFGTILLDYLRLQKGSPNPDYQKYLNSVKVNTNYYPTSKSTSGKITVIFTFVPITLAILVLNKKKLTFRNKAS